MKNRRIVIVAFLLIATLTIGIGYAALTDNLTIIGNAHVDVGAANNAFDAKVAFIAAEATSSTGTGTTADVASFTADDATFTANRLAITGEQSVFTFTVENQSNVDATITIEDTKLSGDANPTNSNETKFDVAYSFPQGQVVAKQGGTITVVVTVSLKEPVTTATSATFGVELTATSEQQ